MEKVKVYTKSNQYIGEIKIASTYWQRLRGLLGTKELKQDEGLLIKPCNSIHTIGMNYSIDVVYLDDSFRILKVCENIAPYRFSNCLKAKMALEIRAFSISEFKLALGQELMLNK